MDNLFKNHTGEQSEHPPGEMLLLFVDGELASKEAAQLEGHLEACWPCRVKTKKIQEGIADIIEFDEQVLTRRIVPPQGWRNFDRKLTELAEASGKQTLGSRLFGTLNRFLPSSHLFSLPRPVLRPMVRNAVAVSMMVLIIALVFRFKHEPTVSATVLLRNAIDAQTRRIKAIDQAVVHQKLQVRRRFQSSTLEESVDWEIWNDTRNARVRQFLAKGDQSIPVSPIATSTKGQPSEATEQNLINDLARVLVANHMDPQRPLSASSYQSWHNTLQRQQDEVTKSKLADGNAALTLRTVPASPVNVGQIAEAVLVVRSKDWQPTEMRLIVAAEDGNRTYELAQTISEVVTLAQVNPAIFADQPIASASAVASPKEVSKTQPTLALAPNTQPLTPSVASAELEVEALRLLNQVGADLGEQVSVKRMADGMLHVSGIVETEQRKAEIINALSPIAANPAVRIEIQTVTEAVAAQRQTKPTPLPSQRVVQIPGDTMAAQTELRAYFAGKGKETDEAVRQYAARMVSLSGQAMDHLWAMKRLLNQFSSEQARSLTPEARAKWIGLIRIHARSYKQNTESLRRELHPIFFPGQSLTAIASDGNEIKDTNELSRVVEHLFELGASNDKVIRSAFTSSTGGVMTTAIANSQFWQSLKNAEGLAARIVRAL